MTQLDMVRSALQELGEDAGANVLSEFIRQRFDLAIDTRFIPVYRATVRGEEQRRQARERAAAIVTEERAASTSDRQSKSA